MMKTVRPWNRLPRKVSGCSLPGSVQGQVGWAFEQPGLVKDVPAHFRRVRPGFKRSPSTQAIL